MSDSNAANLRLMAAALSTQTIHALLEAWRLGEDDLALLDPEVTYQDNSLPVAGSAQPHGAGARRSRRVGAELGRVPTKVPRGWARQPRWACVRSRSRRADPGPRHECRVAR